MARARQTNSETYFGIWTVAQGALFMGISALTLHAAFRTAEVLYAEDFDTPAGAPPWFGIWRVTMLHPYLTTSVFLFVGALLVTAGFIFTTRGQSAGRWMEWILILAFICIFMLSVSLLPLSNMGKDWGGGTLAHELRLDLVSDTVAAWFEIATLLLSIAIARRLRR